MTDFDVVTLGRVSMDLYAQEIGADITDVSGFDAMVGGSPSNIAIGSARLGNRVAAITAVGNDEVGRFVTAHLAREGVDTRWVPTKAQGRTGLAILGVQPPDHFPLTFYRDNPADVYLTVADVLAAPITRTHALVLSGTALSRGTCKEATYAAAEAARDAGVRVFLDLDLRPDQWSDGAGYGAAIRRLLPLVDVAIGTEEEFWSALVPAASPSNEALSARRRDELDGRLAHLRSQQPLLVVVLKRGSRGVTILTEEASDVAGFPVEVVNTVGAGDSFAAGLVTGFVRGMPWTDAARLANACGAIVVGRHGCSQAMPTMSEVETFISEHHV